MKAEEWESGRVGECVCVTLMLVVSLVTPRAGAALDDSGASPASVDAPGDKTDASSTAGLWGDSDEWRMIGANEGHTSAVTCKLNLPLHESWRVSAATLGAPAGEPAYLHPRALAYGVLLVELDTPHEVALLALDARNGAVRWKAPFPTRRMLPDAGLYPAVDDEDVALYLDQASPGQRNGEAWNLCCLDLASGKIEWEVGTMKLKRAMTAPQTYQTLFRPVVSTGSQLLITPDFFGRPPLAAFSWKDGSVVWRSDSTGCDVPTTASPTPDTAMAFAADYVAGHPVLRTTQLKDGKRGGAVVAQQVGSGDEWTGGVWDSQVHWYDEDSGTCCVSVGRLRQETTWPAASSVISVPGSGGRTAWTADGPDSLDGPVLEGGLFLGRWEASGGNSLLRLDVTTGHTVWTVQGETAGKPLLAAPGVVIGRSAKGQMVAWSSLDGRVQWTSPSSYLRDCIAGEGEVVGSYGGSHPTAGTALLAAYR